MEPGTKNKEGEIHPGQQSGEYTPERISNLIFWSFYMSQGSVDLQKNVFQALVALFPQSINGIKAWDAAMEENRDFSVYHSLKRRLSNYIAQPAHSDWPRSQEKAEKKSLETLAEFGLSDEWNTLRNLVLATDIINPNAGKQTGRTRLKNFLSTH